MIRLIRDRRTRPYFVRKRRSDAGKWLKPLFFAGVVAASVFAVAGGALAFNPKAGTLQGLPAGECRADSDSWVGAELAANRPELGADAAQADFSYADSAVWQGGGGGLVCSGFASPENTVKDAALSLSFATGSGLEARAGQQLSLGGSGSNNEFELEKRAELLAAEVYSGEAQLDGLLKVMVSPDRGASWEHLYTFRAAEMSNQTFDGYVSVVLPPHLVRSLSDLSVRIDGLRGGETGWTAYVDSVFVSYEAGPGQQLSIKSLTDAGGSGKPAFGSNSPAVFRFERAEFGDAARNFAGRVSNLFSNGEPDADVGVTITGPGGQKLEGAAADVKWAKSRLAANDAWEIAVNQPADITPGKHTVTVELTDAEGNVMSAQQDFLWGVLAINTHKSIYQGGDTVRFDMAVLDDAGEMVCDADVTLEIDGPFDAVLSTQDGSIKVNEDCQVLAVTENPDYEASWEVPKALFSHQNGEYQLTLTAATANGTHSITDSFRVGGPEPALIERRGHTRIMPASAYNMQFEVTPREDFDGVITEIVPDSFTLTGYQDVHVLPLNSTASLIPAETSIVKDDTGGKQRISWKVSLKKDKTYRFSYYYDAPNVSPEFYLLGPATAKSDGLSFIEPRQWQVASDTTESLWASSHLAGGVSTPNNALGATDGTFTTDIDDTDWTSRWAMEDPSSTITTLTQTINVVVRKDASGGGDPTVDTVTLYENGTSVATLVGSTSITSATGQTLTGTFNGSAISNQNDVEIEVATTGAGGAPTNRRSVQVDSIEWVADLFVTTAGTSGSHTSTALIPTTDLYVGGAFTFLKNNSGRTVNVTSITLHNTGTVDAQNDLSSVSLYYKQESTCSSSIPGDATLFNSTAGNFDASGDVTVTGTMPINSQFSPTCVFVELDVDSTANNNDTLKLEITDPSADVVVSNGLVEPGTAVAISGSVTLEDPKPDAPTFVDSDGTNQIAFNNSRMDDATPMFRAKATHTGPGGTFDRFQVELNDDPTFTNSTELTGTFSGTYSSGTEYNLQTTSGMGTLSSGTTYYARARASADSGSSYGAWSTSTWTYTYNTATTTPEWFQTTDEQFDTGTLTDTETSGSDSVQLAAGNPQTPTHVQSDATFSATSGSSISRAFGSNNTAGNTNVLSVTYDPGFNPIVLVSCTDSQSNPYTIEITETTTGRVTLVCYSTNISGGSNTVTVSFKDDSDAAVNVANRGLTISEYSNIDTSDPVDVTSGNSSSGGSQTSGSATTTQNGDLIYGALALGSSDTISAGSGFTLRASDGIDRIGSEDMVQSTAGSVAATFSTIFTVNYSAVMVAFKAEGTAATSGDIMSEPAQFSDVDGATGWDTFDWTETESPGTVSVQAYHDNDNNGTCDTLVSNTDLSGNSSGFSTGSVDVSGLSTSTYNELCLKASFTDSGGTPFLLDWTVTWTTSSNTAPNAPTNLVQRKVDDTVLGIGDWSNQSGTNAIEFTGTVSDPDGSDTVKLCVELKSVGTAFNGTDEQCSTAVSNGSTAVLLYTTSLSHGTAYHWRARAEDNSVAKSASWVSYPESPTNAESVRDFGVDTTNPTGGTVYDGTSTGVDANFNDGSLSNLSANWSGFSDADAGIDKYEYSIGTTQGGTDTKGWTLLHNYADMPGTTTNFVEASQDTSATSITGSIDLRVDLAADDWTPAATQNLISKWTETGDQRSYLVQLSASGTVQFSRSTDGTSTNTVTSTGGVDLSSLANGERKQIRVTYNTSTGAVDYYTRDSGTDLSVDTGWGTATSDTITSGTMFDGTAKLAVGAKNAGANDNFDGKVYEAHVENLSGSTVANPDFRENDQGVWSGGSVTDDFSNNWTLSSGSTYTLADTSVTATGLTLQTSELYYFNIRVTDNATNTTTISSDGQSVLPTLDFSVSPTSITFANLNSGNSYTNTQDTTLTTSTNAYAGYEVRAWATDNLFLADDSVSIPWHAGSWNSPQTAGAGYGYSTSDTSVDGAGTDLFTFATTPKYAPFSEIAPGEIIADTDGPQTGTQTISNETYTIRHRVQSDASQAAGAYDTTIIYIVTVEY